jgi:hypothetical protein
MLQQFLRGFNWQFAFSPTLAGPCPQTPHVSEPPSSIANDDLPVGAAQLTEPGVTNGGRSL